MVHEDALMWLFNDSLAEDQRDWIKRCRPKIIPFIRVLVEEFLKYQGPRSHVEDVIQNLVVSLQEEGLLCHSEEVEEEHHEQESFLDHQDESISGDIEGDFEKKHDKDPDEYGSLENEVENSPCLFKDVIYDNVLLEDLEKVDHIDPLEVGIFEFLHVEEGKWDFTTKSSKPWRGKPYKTRSWTKC